MGGQSKVSQRSFLCTASDISISNNPLITDPISIEKQTWVAADPFLGMGVTVGKGAVVGARAVAFRDVEAWTIVGGNSAKMLKKRRIY